MNYVVFFSFLFFFFLLPVLTSSFLLTGGPLVVNFPSGLILADVEKKNPLVTPGGCYSPPDCEARHRTAIIIPYRHRENHLKYLLYHLHPFLQRQQLSYQIYIINQVLQSPNVTSIQHPSKKWKIHLKNTPGNTNNPASCFHVITLPSLHAKFACCNFDVLSLSIQSS